MSQPYKTIIQQTNQLFKESNTLRLNCISYTPLICKTHTEPLFQRSNVLKVTDLVSLNQCLLIHKFKANRLPPTFKSAGLSSSIKDSDYNYKHNNVNRDYLCYYPHYQAVKAWNCTNIDIKCQGEEELFQQRFISSKVFSYEYECSKQNCYSCK